ncbi:MAG: 16S rRNA (cytosine(1402)-N(4))-methyltransferase [Spirochaetales bacterium]|nr:16S rRNA (cytosine(1402)-N(4))-methyltransferase [Spirochaetales bacterium]
MSVVHSSVLKKEVYEFLRPESEGNVLIDATVGEGGHAELFLQAHQDINVVGVDADSHILGVARRRLGPFGGRVKLYNQWFNSFFANYPEEIERPDRILFDLGISTFHYARAERGFSFQRDEALDMRLEPGLELNAADIINEYPVGELADLFFEYGEERYSRRIAREIARARSSERISTSGRLAEIIWNAVPPNYRHGRIHPATRSFQALRVVVNGELVRLSQALDASLRVLKVGGKMGVIAFHSLEDRMVKGFFREKNKSCTCPPEWPMCKCEGRRVVDLLTKKPIRAGAEEVSQNPSSRSARLRVVRKEIEERFEDQN